MPFWSVKIQVRAYLKRQEMQWQALLFSQWIECKFSNRVYRILPAYAVRYLTTSHFSVGTSQLNISVELNSLTSFQKTLLPKCLEREAASAHCDEREDALLSIRDLFIRNSYFFSLNRKWDLVSSVASRCLPGLVWGWVHLNWNVDSGGRGNLKGFSLWGDVDLPILCQPLIRRRKWTWAVTHPNSTLQNLAFSSCNCPSTVFNTTAFPTSSTAVAEVNNHNLFSLLQEKLW